MYIYRYMMFVILLSLSSIMPVVYFHVRYVSRKGEWLSIPPGWLCYLAPEIMRALQARNPQEHDLPFNKGSDVYAFG